MSSGEMRVAHQPAGAIVWCTQRDEGIYVFIDGPSFPLDGVARHEPAHAVRDDRAAEGARCVVSDHCGEGIGSVFHAVSGAPLEDCYVVEVVFQRPHEIVPAVKGESFDFHP